MVSRYDFYIMKHRFSPWGVVVAAAAVTLLACGCSTVESRISEHPDLYHSLSARQQQLVANGQIAPGMPRDAVYLAWGTPDQRVEGAMRGQMTETWIYVQYTSYPYGYGYGYGYPYRYGWGGGFGGVIVRRHHHGRSFAFVGDPFYDPFYYSYIPPSIPYPYRTVTFANGRVVSFQSLVGPYRY
jgi:hypothetical protein